MIPILLVVGLAAGVLSSRLRVLAIVGALLGLTWAVAIALTTATDAADVLVAFALGAANSAVGVVIGAALRVAIVGLAPGGPRARGGPAA